MWTEDPKTQAGKDFLAGYLSAMRDAWSGIDSENLEEVDEQSVADAKFRACRYEESTALDPDRSQGGNQSR